MLSTWISGPLSCARCSQPVEGGETGEIFSDRDGNLKVRHRGKCPENFRFIPIEGRCEEEVEGSPRSDASCAVAAQRRDNKGRSLCEPHYEAWRKKNNYVDWPRSS